MHIDLGHLIPNSLDHYRKTKFNALEIQNKDVYHAYFKLKNTCIIDLLAFDSSEWILKACSNVNHLSTILIVTQINQKV